MSSRERGRPKERRPSLWRLLQDGGEITIGRIGPIRCAGVASDGTGMVAGLQRESGEGLEEFLDRLDSAVREAWEHETTIDELNG